MSSDYTHADPADPEEVFAPHWPEGLDAGDVHRTLCDDKGRNERAFLEVLLAGDGDVHVTMQDGESFSGDRLHPIPTIRKRTSLGGGKDMRTRQALLWLALAIKLDNEDRNAR